MFNNVGGKIKGIAVFVCILGVVGSTILGLSMLSSGGDMAGIIGLFAIIFGGIGSWIISLFTYGFGELIEKTTEIAKNTRSTAHHGASLEERIDTSLDTSPIDSGEDDLAFLEQCRADGLVDEEEYLKLKRKIDSDKKELS